MVPRRYILFYVKGQLAECIAQRDSEAVVRLQELRLYDTLDATGVCASAYA